MLLGRVFRCCGGSFSAGRLMRRVCLIVRSFFRFGNHERTVVEGQFLVTLIVADVHVAALPATIFAPNPPSA